MTNRKADAIINAVLDGDVKRLRELMSSVSKDEESFINCYGKSGLAPIHFAAYKQNYKLLQSLIDFGADYNICDVNGQSIVHISVILGDPYQLELLIPHCEIETKNNAGETPSDISLRVPTQEDISLFTIYQGWSPTVQSDDFKVKIADGRKKCHYLLSKTIKYRKLARVQRFRDTLCQKKIFTLDAMRIVRKAPHTTERKFGLDHPIPVKGDKDSWSTFDISYYNYDKLLISEMHIKLFSIDFVHKVVTDVTKSLVKYRLQNTAKIERVVAH